MKKTKFCITIAYPFPSQLWIHVQWAWLYSVVILEFSSRCHHIPEPMTANFWSQFLFLSSPFPFVPLALDSTFLPLVFNLDFVAIFVSISLYHYKHFYQLWAHATVFPCCSTLVPQRPTQTSAFGLRAGKVQIKHLPIGDSFSNHQETISNFKRYAGEYSIMHFMFQIYCHVIFRTILILDPDSDKVRRETYTFEQLFKHYRRLFLTTLLSQQTQQCDYYAHPLEKEPVAQKASLSGQGPING